MAAPERFVATRYGERPLYRPLRALGASAVVGALATDIAYLLTADFIWVDGSDWLLLIGAAFGFIALVVGLIEIAARRLRVMRPRLASVLFDLIGWALVVVDNLVHSRDGWTSVAPWGITLSALAVFFIVLSEWAQRSRPAPALVEGVA